MFGTTIAANIARITNTSSNSMSVNPRNSRRALEPDLIDGIMGRLTGNTSGQSATRVSSKTRAALDRCTEVEITLRLTEETGVVLFMIGIVWLFTARALAGLAASSRWAR